MGVSRPAQLPPRPPLCIDYAEHNCTEGPVPCPHGRSHAPEARSNAGEAARRAICHNFSRGFSCALPPRHQQLAAAAAARRDPPRRGGSSDSSSFFCTKGAHVTLDEAVREYRERRGVIPGDLYRLAREWGAATSGAAKSSSLCVNFIKHQCGSASGGGSGFGSRQCPKFKALVHSVEGREWVARAARREVAEFRQRELERRKDEEEREVPRYCRRVVVCCSCHRHAAKPLVFLREPPRSSSFLN